MVDRRGDPVVTVVGDGVAVAVAVVGVLAAAAVAVALGVPLLEREGVGT